MEFDEKIITTAHLKIKLNKELKQFNEISGNKPIYYSSTTKTTSGWYFSLLYKLLSNVIQDGSWRYAICSARLLLFSWLFFLYDLNKIYSKQNLQWALVNIFLTFLFYTLYINIYYYVKKNLMCQWLYIRYTYNIIYFPC